MGHSAGEFSQRLKLFQLSNSLLHLLAFATDLRFAQFSLDCRKQPRGIALDDVVLGSGFHGIDCYFFADGA